MKLIILLACLLSFNTLLAQQEKKLPVSLAQVKAYSSQSLSWFNATVISRQNIAISSERSGRIIWMAEFGEHKKKGELVAEIDHQSLQLKLRYQQQVLLRARENSDYRAKELKRLESMKKVQGISQTQVDQARHDYKIALIELEQQKINLETIQQDISKSRIYAPFKSVVEIQHLQTGEYADSGQALLTLVNHSAPEVRLFAPIDLVNHLVMSQPLTIKQGAQQGTARLTARSYSADEKSRQLEIRLRPENPDLWNIGQALQVGIPENIASNTLSIPRDALVVDQHGNSIFRMNTENTVERVPVKVISGDAEIVAVSGKLKIGDQVVVRGSGMLKTGDQVNPI